MNRKQNTQWYIIAEENHQHQITVVYATIRGDKTRHKFFVCEIPLYDTVKLTQAVIDINYSIHLLGFKRVLDLTQNLYKKWVNYHQFVRIKNEVDKDNPF